MTENLAVRLTPSSEEVMRMKGLAGCERLPASAAEAGKRFLVEAEPVGATGESEICGWRLTSTPATCRLEALGKAGGAA